MEASGNKPKQNHGDENARTAYCPRPTACALSGARKRVFLPKFLLNARRRRGKEAHAC